ncbi:TrmH family RNA methyltransferase [Salegentibacter flavus]|uniref:RNA methyltransferase, TrmH family n=1 Tax=Salegentibacter flavus TaxID=287099 RepID=A0A1I4YUD1_9FLAO|nr:RNA methyltransferase [Salegentibacter flavus]SFN41645.1 RNA methyltransferase, TrmH family [Salegentibacter flavus]
MVSKSQIKLIRSLGQKKYRLKNAMFIVEGEKSIREFLSSRFVLEKLYTTEDCFEIAASKIEIISEADLKKISQLKTPQIALAVFKIPKQESFRPQGLVVALDGVRDPGNLGTIIRLCDWFGIQNLICSSDTADIFNPKVVQASMGSLTRVEVVYSDLAEFIKNTDKLPVFGAFMEGENIYTKTLPAEGILVMGNEANGISEKIEKLITQKIGIPRFGDTNQTESLNVATATAILLSEFKRR